MRSSNIYLKGVCVKKIIAASTWILIWLGCLMGCAVHPVTLEKELMIISEEKEIDIGRKTDPYIVQQMGYYDDPELQDYVNRIGQKLVEVCRRKDIDYHFKVLDTDDINAFAVPGGYIYVTRGILAVMNSEAELAGVLGHEIGHVVGRDSANQISQQTLFQVAALAGMAAPGTRDLAVAGNMLFNSIMLGYGREKEFLADAQGVEYMGKAGYDPSQMAKFQYTLAKIYQGPGGYAQYLSTHPDIFDRIKRTDAQAKVQRAMNDALSRLSKGNDSLNDSTPKKSGGAILADEYKDRLDGLAYGPPDNIRRIQVYTVKEGDTLQSVAANLMDDHGQIKELAFLNGLEMNDPLVAGQKLKLVY